MQNPQSILNSIFGYSEFRSPQEEIINTILAGRDTLAVLPTGGGKSICYQIPAVIFEGMTVVISPLLSLMKDQIHQIENKIPSASLNSSISFNEQQRIIKRVMAEEIKLLYVSPERFSNASFLQILSNANISFFAVDEAHCISEWGHDFRPSYRKLNLINKYFPKAVMGAFTASATPEVREDIIFQLGLRSPQVFINGFERKNLILKVIKTGLKQKKIKEIIKSVEGSKIIYCQSRKETEEISEFLISNKISCLPYHAGMTPEDRKAVQEFFIRGKAEVIAATNAFGLGINKENIRAVIHYNMPGTIENFYQEIGRAGRDGKESYAILLYKDSNDRRIHEYFIKNSAIDRELAEQFYTRLNNYTNTKTGENNSYLYPTDIRQLNKILNISITQGQLSSLLTFLVKHKVIEILQGGKNNKLRIKAEYSPAELKGELPVNEQILYEMFFRKRGSVVKRDFQDFDISEFIGEDFSDENDIYENLNSLKDKGLIELVQGQEKEGFRFLIPRKEFEALKLDFSEPAKIASKNLSKLNLIHRFIKSKECRWKFILDYFEEKTESNYRCGKCDNCINAPSKEHKSDTDIKTEILKTAAELKGKFGITVIADVLTGSKNKKIKENNLTEASSYGFLSGIPKEQIKDEINKLIVDGYLDKSDDFYPTVSITVKGKNSLGDRQIKEIDFEESREENVISDLVTGEPSIRLNLSLYERLQTIRKQTAWKFNQPEFMICNDEALREISIKAPETAEALKSINGITEKFILKCGDVFLNEIKAYKQELNRDKKEDKIYKLPPTVQTTYQMIQAGMGFHEICEKRNMTDTVISEHIQTLIKNKFSITLEKLISAENIELIRKAIKDTRSKFLPVIKSQLPEHINYGEIRVVMAFDEKE